jgi:signal transduction histidine kinase
VPVWFAAARTTIVDEMTKALGGARAMVDDVHQRRAAVTAAAQRLELAQTACEPFDNRVTAARQTLDTAVRDRDTTADRAERARFLARRDAKTQLDVAERAVASARTSLAEVEHAAEPARAERRVAAAELDRLERHHRDHGIIDSYNYSSQRAVELERKLAAVDRWHEWANGTPMTPNEIGRLYQELERGLQHDWLRDNPAAQLADTLKHWATDHDIALPPPQPAQRGPERYLGIER